MVNIAWVVFSDIFGVFIACTTDQTNFILLSENEGFIHSLCFMCSFF